MQLYPHHRSKKPKKPLRQIQEQSYMLFAKCFNLFEKPSIKHVRLIVYLYSHTSHLLCFSYTATVSLLLNCSIVEIDVYIICKLFTTNTVFLFCHRMFEPSSEIRYTLRRKFRRKLIKCQTQSYNTLF